MTNVSITGCFGQYGRVDESLPDVDLGAHERPSLSNFYAIEASRHLGLGEAGGIRIGLAPYANAEDIDRLLEGLRSII